MSATNADQRQFWSEDAGPIWVAQQRAMDQALAPVLKAVLDAAMLAPGDRVLDIGCGAGTSTGEAAALVGPQGLALGLDISPTLLAQAEARAANVPQAQFLQADAQVHAFDGPGFDHLISRFGVMFFEDTQAAFSNLARALNPGGRLSMATWGPIPDNPYFTLPAAVAKDVIGPVERSDPDLPGPFALRDTEFVEKMLAEAGFADIHSDPRQMMLTPPGTTRDVAALFCQIGPAQKALSVHAASPEQHSALIDALADAVEVYATSDGVRIPALINIFNARKAA